ncbi:hypothetical protein AB0M29_40520 [Streptomyces sp. NPDC051976]|uniref:hypothetical protein n=1 Tax=Streptomyces sp. NPDC051976 TaxID=3154947 RepID=UPI003430CF99
MTRTTLPAAVVFAASTALLLTGCGGGSSDSPDRAQSSAIGTPGTPTTSATSTRSAEPGAPTFDLPPDVRIEFAGFDAGGGKDKDVMRDAGYAITALLEAEATVHATETANFKRYWTGLSGATYADTIIARGRQGKVITGTYRYYSPRVTPNAQGAQVVSYCEDQRKAYAKDARTGRVRVTTPSLSDFRSWSLVMSRNSAGGWQVANYTWHQGARNCQVA